MVILENSNGEPSQYHVQFILKEVNHERMIHRLHLVPISKKQLQQVLNDRIKNHIKDLLKKHYSQHQFDTRT